MTTESKSDSNTPNPIPHSVLQSIFLHLLPGASMLTFHVLIVGSVTKAGFPAALSWNVLTNILVFHPLLFGVLFYLAKKRGNTGLSLEGIVVYTRPMAIWKHAGWTLFILLLTAPVFALFEPLTNYLHNVFHWVPKTDGAYDGEFPEPMVAAIFGLSILLTAIVTPLAEELYYRGYLLPRMPRVFGSAGPVVHSFLFAIHHFHSPWMIAARTVGLLPLIYVTRHTRSVVPGIVAHMIVNAIDLISWGLNRWR